jgi:hypothetical protein
MTIKALFPSSEPALELDFANTKALDPRISFTRASTGTCVGADGLIKTAARGTARFDHNSATGESLGLLVEDARTNRMWPSENIVINVGGGQTWTHDGTGILITNAIAVAPNNLISAAKIYKPNATAASYLRMAPASAPSTSDTISIYLKAAELTSVDIQFTSIGYATINLSTGTTNAGSLERLSNGWYRFSYTPTSAPGDVRIFPGGALVVGDGTSGIFVWGGQIEVGSVPSSYIPTTAATATRAADVATVSNTNSSIFPTSSFTTINSPFGTAGGGSTVRLVGPTIKRTAIYNGDLPQSQINALTGTDQWWRWRVTGGTFALPSFSSDGNVTVDWGDGVVETMTTGVHTFLDNNVYHTIGFRLNSGTSMAPSINTGTYKDRVIAVGPVPANMKINGSVTFRGCGQLRAIDGYASYTGGALTYAFANTAISSFPLIDTSSITNFTAAWSECGALNLFPLINTAAGTSFQSAWNYCSSLISFPLINTAAGTNFLGAWANCSSLTSFPLINTGSGTNFSSAWSECTGLTSFPLINTAAATDIAYAWKYNFGLTSFPLINTGAVTNFTRAWWGCTSLISFPAINTSSAITFNGAWDGCSSLASFPANVFNTTGTLASDAFIRAFNGCALTAASIENILTSLVTNGRSNITLELNGGSNAGASTWTANAITAYNTLISRGWTISRNA